METMSIILMLLALFTFSETKATERDNCVTVCYVELDGSSTCTETCTPPEK